MADKDLYSGLIRLHILHHACQEPIFGAGIIEELARHGYSLSPGTLYPLLHGLEQRGYLRSSGRSDGRQSRREYRATLKGRKALAAAVSIKRAICCPRVLQERCGARTQPLPAQPAVCGRLEPGRQHHDPLPGWVGWPAGMRARIWQDRV